MAHSIVRAGVHELVLINTGLLSYSSITYSRWALVCRYACPSLMKCVDVGGGSGAFVVIVSIVTVGVVSADTACRRRVPPVITPEKSHCGQINYGNAMVETRPSALNETVHYCRNDTSINIGFRIQHSIEILGISFFAFAIYS